MWSATLQRCRKQVLHLLLLTAILAPPVFAREWRDIRNEADRDLPPRMQYYNKLKGKPKLLPWETDDPESLNVRLVGKWGRGPAASVTGRDTLIYLGMGSEVAIFNVANGSNPRIINEIQCRYVVDRVILKDNLLYAVLQGGIEVFDITDPARAFRIKYLPLSVVDMCIRDTLAYTIDADSFKVYRIVSPESLARVGACADSGYYITADQGFAYLCDRWGLYVVDATNPASPHRASSLAGGGGLRAVLVEGGYCYYTHSLPSPEFVIADVTDPYSPFDTGRLGGIAGFDLYKLGFFVYMPGYQIVDVSLVNNPAIIGSTSCGGYGVWTRSPYSYGFVAAYSDGLATIRIADPVHPLVDTSLAGTDASRDLSVSGNLACVAAYRSGLHSLDVAVPSIPFEVGKYDSAGDSPVAQAVATQLPFAYLMASVWYETNFRVVDLTDPSNPRLTATCGTWNPGEAVVVRDSLAFVGEHGRFEVFSIANPRAPRLVGSCGLPGPSGSLCLVDTLAYISPELRVVNISNPSQPRLVYELPDYNNSSIAVQDTFAYIVHAYDSLCVFSVADPLNPRKLGWAPLPNMPYDVLVNGSRAYVGCSDLRVFDISAPSQPVEIGYYKTPYRVRRLRYADGLIYAACFGAGVCILETLPTSSIADDDRTRSQLAPSAFRFSPNPTTGTGRIESEWNLSSDDEISFSDIGGRVVKCIRPNAADCRSGQMDISLVDLQPGVYFATLRSGNRRTTTKIVRQ